MWVGLGNWVGIVLKKENPIKNNGFRVKPDLIPNTYPIMATFLFLFSHGRKRRIPKVLVINQV